MTDFNAKMHQIRFRQGLGPSPRWEELTALPRPPSWIWGRFAAGGGAGLGRGGKGGGKGREEEVEGGKGRAPSYC